MAGCWEWCYASLVDPGCFVAVGGVNGSEACQGAVLDHAEELLGVTSVTETIEECLGGGLKIWDCGGDAIETDELRLNYTFKSMFGVLACLVE